MLTITLERGRDKALRRGHPWIFGRAIRQLDPELEPGTAVRIVSADGGFLAVGYVNPRCTIAARVVAREDVAIDQSLLAEHIKRALRLRDPLSAEQTNVYRLVNGEGDFLPGFVVDRFADTLVVQCLTAGADRLREPFVAALQEVVRPSAVIEHSRGSVRKAEGLPDREEVHFGDRASVLDLRECGVRVVADPGRGQKTGYFCDQRENRRRLREGAEGRRVLDAFCYSGGFATSAALGGATSIVAVDSSRDALLLAQRTLTANDVPADRCVLHRAKVAEYLRSSDETFDAVVLDPPPLVRRRGDLQKGLRGYRDLNLWAMRRLAPGGLLFTFTCSQHVDDASFRRAIADAGAADRRDVRVLARLGPGIDHPVASGHVEGEYLRGLLLAVG